jgi:hypothetical protein
LARSVRARPRLGGGPDIQGVPVRESSQTRAPSFISVQLRLEMKL